MASRTPASDADASIGQLVAGIQQDLTNLVRGEIDLAKAELRQSAARAGLGSGLLAAAAFLVLLAVILTSIALAYALVALGLHPGWAFLIVAAFYVVLAAILGLVARSRFTRIRGPERTQKVAARAKQALRPRSRT
jgi:uncharacterized membrane protein YqjE